MRMNTPLVGRENELRLLETLLEGCRGGSSAALVLRGDAGIGKSALLRRVIDSAQDILILQARGIESESELAFAGLADLLKPLTHRLKELPAPQAAALAGALALAPSISGDRFTVCAATLTLLATAAEDDPVLVCVDDAHWLDHSSLEALLFTARRLGAEGIVILFAARTGEAPLLDIANLPEMQVDRLNADAAMRLLNRESTRPVDSGVAEQLVSLASGNPLALLEMANVLPKEALAGKVPLEQPLPVGPNTEGLFRARLACLNQRELQLLVIAAAAGPIEIAVIAEAAKAARLGLGALQVAEETGLISLEGGRVDFVHPLMRSTVYGNARRARQRAAHRALAVAMSKKSGEAAAASRSWHLAAATVRPNEEVASALEATADMSLARNAYAAAAKALERGAQLTPLGDRRARRFFAAARAACLAGQAAQAIHQLDEAETQAADPLLRSDLQQLRGLIDTWRIGPAAARKTLIHEASRVEGTDSARAAWLLISATVCCLMDADVNEGLALARRAYHLGRGAEPALRARVNLLLGASLVLNGDARRGLSLITEQVGATTPDLDIKDMLVGHVGMPFMWCEEYERAQDIFDAVIEAARFQAAPFVLPYVLGAQSELRFRLGLWDAALASASEATQLAAEIDQGVAQAHGLVCTARVEAARGLESACRDHLRQALAIVDRVGAESIRHYVASVKGLLELSQGNAEASIADLQQLDRDAEVLGMANPGVLQHSANLVEACVRSGHRKQARVALSKLDREAARAQHKWGFAAAARCRGLLSESAGNPGHHFAVAIEWHGQTRSPFELARTELCWGESLRRERKRAQARAHLRIALELFEKVGATPWIQRASSELRACGETKRRPRSRSGPQELTPQELQVVLAVSKGQSNREAATALFLSRKTVEYHLSNVYRKLGLSSRTELIRLALASETLTGEG